MNFSIILLMFDSGLAGPYYQISILQLPLKIGMNFFDNFENVNKFTCDQKNVENFCEMTKHDVKQKHIPKQFLGYYIETLFCFSALILGTYLSLQLRKCLLVGSRLIFLPNDWVIVSIPGNFFLTWGV